MKKVILTVKETTTGNNAGPKAKLDIEKFLVEKDFAKWNFEINQHSVLQKAKTAYIDIPSFLRKHSDADEIFLQYPMYSQIVTKQLINKISKMNVKLFLIIHDVESLRLHLNEQEYIKEELSTFNKADGLIVHNEQMKKWLADNGISVPMVTLGIFDYISGVGVADRTHDQYPSICFAGNLKKAKFLGDLSFAKVRLDVFGPNPLDKYGTNVFYKGQYSPDELPKYLNENFGLVWDGSTPHTCDGLFGNYMRFNNPHKASLYLSSGIPVIIWRKAALAQFIEEHNVGLAIDDLNDLDKVLSELSSEDYQQMVKNAQLIAQKLRNGFYIYSAIQKLETKIKEK